MARSNIPSLQQVIKNLFDTSDLVRRAWVKTALNPPRISYRMLHRVTLELVCLRTPLAQIEAGIRLGEKRPNHLKNLLDILSLIDGHFRTLEPDFPPIEVECRYYRIAPDIIIPFHPRFATASVANCTYLIRTIGGKIPCAAHGCRFS